MPLPRPLRLAPLAFLVACGTPQERCIAGNTRDARVIAGLVAETEANLARGYALEEVVELQNDWVDCTPPPTPEKPNPRPDMCFVEVPVEVTRPVAIDLNAEAAKLASLKERQLELLARQDDIIAQCQAAYPES